MRPSRCSTSLAHGERDKVRAAYNHAQYLAERREMMQWWADFLDELNKDNQSMTCRSDGRDSNRRLSQGSLSYPLKPKLH
jgi:hypothetical protein